MREKQERIWLRHVMVAVFYFLGYTLSHSVSFAFWLLPAGFRLTCLLLMPYRYWPALAVGEMLSMARVSYACYFDVGPFYAYLNLLPQSLIAMPVVRVAKERLHLFRPKREISIGVLMACAFVVSALLAIYNYLRLTLVPLPHGQNYSIEWLPRYFLGQYLGVLTVVPIALAAWQVWCRGSWRDMYKQLYESRLAIDSVVILLPSVTLLTWMTMQVPGPIGQAARFATFLPVAALAMRHGWRGAAIGGTAASIAIVLAMPKAYDPATLQAEVLIAFTISMLLMLGARIATLHAREEKERIDARLVLQAAQQGLYLGELRMRHAADAIEQIATSFHHVQGRALERIRHVLSPTEEHSFSKQVIASRYEAFQVANGLSPRAWQIRGLSYALREASIAHAFAIANINYQCDIKSESLEHFDAGVQLALYRLVCEAAAYLYEQATLSSVRLLVRAGQSNGRRWLAARMDGVHATNTQELMPALVACEQFKQQIGATGLAASALRDQAVVYGGTVHLRSTTHVTRLALLLHDAERITSVPVRVN